MSSVTIDQLLESEELFDLDKILEYKSNLEQFLPEVRKINEKIDKTEPSKVRSESKKLLASVDSKIQKIRIARLKIDDYVKELKHCHRLLGSFEKLLDISARIVGKKMIGTLQELTRETIKKYHIVATDAPIQTLLDQPYVEKKGNGGKKRSTRKNKK